MLVGSASLPYPTREKSEIPRPHTLNQKNNVRFVQGDRPKEGRLPRLEGGRRAGRDLLAAARQHGEEGDRVHNHGDGTARAAHAAGQDAAAV